MRMNSDFSLNVGSIPTFAEITNSAYRNKDLFTVDVDRVPFMVGNLAKSNAGGNAVQFLEPSYFSSEHCVAMVAIPMATSDLCTRNGVY
jgi:hypothetical protein